MLRTTGSTRRWDKLMGQGIVDQRAATHTNADPWIQRLADIIKDLRLSPWDVLDRAKFQILFEIDGDKAATRLMRKLGATGRPLTITRVRLLEALEEYGADGYDVAELERRRAFAERFAAIRSEYVEHPPVPVVAPADAAKVKLNGIAEHVKLSPGRIVVDFRDIEEMKKKLLLLAMAAGNEPDAFVEMVEPQEPKPKRAYRSKLRSRREMEKEYERLTKWELPQAPPDLSFELSAVVNCLKWVLWKTGDPPTEWLRMAVPDRQVKRGERTPRLSDR
jgi:hypothetical protein